MFGIEDYLFAVVLHILNRLGADGEVIFERAFQHLCYVHVPGLADQRYHGYIAGEQGAERSVCFNGRVGSSGAAECRDLCVFQLEFGNGGEEPLLSMPGDLDGSIRQYIRVDKVNYDDEGLWPTAPDGLGSSLSRITATNYGNDVANWQAATPSPGRADFP